MAREIVTKISDDLGGVGSAEPLRFSVNGRKFVIDLNKRNTDTFLRRLAPYIEAAQPDPPGYSRPRVNSEAAKVREWARENGHVLGDRGRIPQEIWDSYNSRVDSLRQMK